MSESMNFDKLHKEYNKTQIYVCQNPGCGKEFYMKRPDRNLGMFCSQLCSAHGKKNEAKINREKYNQNPNKCLQCKQSILYKEGDIFNDIKRKKFCNRSCAATHNNIGSQKSEKMKNKMREIAKNNPNGFLSPNYVRKIKEKIYKICAERNCNKQFHFSSQNTKYCSIQCYNKNSGGFKKGSSRGKSGYYKNIWCDSTYELAYIIYCIDHNVSIERNLDFWEYDFEEKTRKYYPDFIINKGLNNESLVEIKGLSRDVDLVKLQAVDKPIIYLNKSKLKHIFEYVENKTNIKIERLYLLYENYIPEKKKCERKECQNEILAIPSKKRIRFCSVSCGAKSRSQKINNKGLQ